MIALAGGGDAMLVAAVTVTVLMLGAWAVSLAVRDASIVDIVWGLGFVAVGWSTLLAVDMPGNARHLLLVVMVTVWGLRLAGYLAWRNIGKGEDYRYRAMRRRWGDRFPVVSLVTVFGLQGLLMWVVSLPLQLGPARDTPIGVVAWVGLAVWLLGMCFETVGDAQLARFKADPDNAGKVMDRGLWRYTRHPNYFGDACVWWGIALVAAETGVGVWGFVGAAVMTLLLRRVSGVTLLERSLSKRREGYADYVARTSPFVPRPPRSGTA